MKKLQIILGATGIGTGLYTVITAIMFLNGKIDNLGFCMVGLALCCFINCCNLFVMVLNQSKENRNSNIKF